MPSTAILPHGVAPQKQRRLHPTQWARTPFETSSDMFLTSRFCLLVLVIAIPSFLLGSTISLYAGVDCSHTKHGSDLNRNSFTESSGKDKSTDELIEKRVQELLKQREEDLLSKHTTLVRKMVEERLKEECNNPSSSRAGGRIIDSDSVGNMVAGITMTPKSNFTDFIDLGVPLDKLSRGSDHVMVLYSTYYSMPDELKQSNGEQSSIPKMTHTDALEHCDYLNVLLLDHSRTRKQCLALVPQYESYHLQKWMRVPEKHNGRHGKLDSSQPLRLVSRGHNGNKEDFPPPRKEVSQRAFEMIRTYLNSLGDVENELRELIKSDLKPYNDKIIIVMVCNFGQSELLMNFACNARARNFDLSAVLVFAADRETEELAKSLGLAAYYDERNFGDIPSEAAQHYGDMYFSAMMVAKIVCVQLISHLGYDLLFQDVDIIWYQHPLSDYFAKPGHWSLKYDTIFQDDGGHTVRYTPYSANSGFYYVRNNLRTRSFLNTLLMSTDMIMETDSHQQAMIAVLNEHVSLYGLRVKVVSRDEDDMPGGFQWNMKSGKYMRAFFNGEIRPLIFHMSWTNNKDNKLKFFQQMGAWHVEERCIAKKKKEIGVTTVDEMVSTCCSAEPIFKCHYNDKPSIRPCKDSPAIDNGKRPSFW